MVAPPGGQPLLHAQHVRAAVITPDHMSTYRAPGLQPTAFVAAGYFFTKGAAVREVPFDPTVRPQAEACVRAWVREQRPVLCRAMAYGMAWHVGARRSARRMLPLRHDSAA